MLQYPHCASKSVVLVSPADKKPNNASDTGNNQINKKQKLLIVVRECQERNDLIDTIIQSEVMSTIKTDLSRFESDLLSDVYDIVLFDKVFSQNNEVNILRSMKPLDYSPKTIVICQTDEEIDRLVAFELGVDDCVGNSCSACEVAARIRALSRQHIRRCIECQKHGAMSALSPDLFAEFGGWVLDHIKRTASDISGNMIEFTNVEYGLLKELLEHPRVVKSRTDILQSSYFNNNDSRYNIRTLDVLIGRIRKKFALYDRNKIIKTVKGFGYLIAD